MINQNGDTFLYLSHHLLQALPIIPLTVDNTEQLPDLAAQLQALSAASSSNSWQSILHSNLDNAQNIALLTSGAIYLLLEKGPRGACRDDLVEVVRSPALPNELGVVAKRFISQGSSLGLYPGYVKSRKRFENSKKSEEALRRARKYAWALDADEPSAGNVLDPTDSQGHLAVELIYLFGLQKMSTTLARINEPPRGKHRLQ
jgi:hypothetical protein